VPQFSGAPESGNEGRITAVDCERQWSAVSNPTLVRGLGKALLGDLHAQSQYHCWCEEDRIGISCGTPEEVYHYAHEVAGLDFCAITDTGSICSSIWTTVSDAALAAHRDGQFVVFQGSEVGDNVDGHRNVLFATERRELGVSPNSQLPMLLVLARTGAGVVSRQRRCDVGLPPYEDVEQLEPVGA